MGEWYTRSIPQVTNWNGTQDDSGFLFPETTGRRGSRSHIKGKWSD